MNPGNNTIPQTNEQTNPVDLHVHLDDEQMLFAEPTALNNTGEVFDKQKAHFTEEGCTGVFL